MAKSVERMDNDALVRRARTQGEALAALYEQYYDRVFRFCVHRLFSRETAEDVTGLVFVTVARGIRSFTGETEQDFRNWLYTIAANQTNAYLRTKIRRQRLLEMAARSRAAAGKVDDDGSSHLDWPRLYAAILQLNPQHQTILVLRFFEGMGFDEIGRIVRARPATVRVTLHRILRRLRQMLQMDFGGD